MTVEIKNKIRTYIEENFRHSSDGSSISDHESLLELGIIDSAGIFELVSFLEKEFDVSIADEDIIPDNFENISSLANLIKSKTN